MLLVAEGNREGDLPFDKVKLDLAEEKSARSAPARWPRPTPTRAGQGQGRRRQVAEGALPGQVRRQRTKADAKTAAKAKTPKPGPRAGFRRAAAPRRPACSRAAGRDGAIVEGLGVSNALSKAAFELQAGAPLAGPFEIAGS